MKLDLRPIVIALLAVGALAWFLLRGESELTDGNVTELIDDGDQLLRNGNIHGICANRARDFTLYETTWNFMSYAQPSTFADIEEKESKLERRSASDESRNNAYSHTYSRKEFCEQLENQTEKLTEIYRRRTDLTIHIDLDKKHAQYEAEYVFVSPLPEGYEYPKGATGDLYVYSRMSESGIIELEDYKPVFKSARVKLRKYWIYPANIPEVDRPPG